MKQRRLCQAGSTRRFVLSKIFMETLFFLKKLKAHTFLMLMEISIFCFDIVEEAFTGMLNGNVPTKRRINAPFEKVLAAESLQRPLVHYCKTKMNYIETPYPRNQTKQNTSRSGRLGVDRNSVSMSTPKTVSAL